MNLKKSLSFCFFATILSAGICYSQTEVPSNATTHFEEYPVELSTGLPRVNIPLGMLPSRTGNIDLSLNYHPSAVAVFNQQLGDAGHGWNLYKGGGTVSRRLTETFPAEHNWAGGGNVTDTYTFNFLGFSGKMEVKKVGNKLEANLVESTSEYLRIYVSAGSDYKIARFKFVDNAGNSYIFDVYDTLVYGGGIQEKDYRNIYHLSEVRTPANTLAAKYFYETKPFNLNNQIMSSSVNVVNKIVSEGFGQINFTYSIYTKLQSYPITRYQGVWIKDFNGNTVKQFNFVFGTHNYTTNMAKLIEVQEVNVLSPSEKQSYLFSYNLGAPLTDKYVLTTDKWGYYSVVAKYCQSAYIAGLPNKNTITSGILKKITYPTGGSIVYDYEPNTYTYDSQKQIDLVWNSVTNQWEPDPLFFSTLGGDNGANNIHNYTKSAFQTKTFNNLSSSPLAFNVSTGKDYYFKFSAEPWEVTGIIYDDPDQVVYMYPGFTLKKNGAVVHIFSSSDNWSNAENHCLGKRIYLASGNYTIEMSHTDKTSGQVEIYTMTKNSSIKKWWYGGGIRIKTIGFFDDADVNQKYFDLGLTQPAPVRRIDYDYNLPDEPGRSSGYLKSSGGTNYGDIVRYKNVTVYDSNKQGKTQYGFVVSGKTSLIKSFDSSNQLVQETSFKYGGNYELIQTGGLLTPINLGTFVPTSIKTKTFQQGQYLEEVQEFAYSYDRQLLISAEASSISNEVITRKYFYDTSENITLLFSSYRSLLERTEKYLNDQLLHTSTITYLQKPFDFGQGDGNYLLPKQTESSKNGINFKLVSKVNLYDDHNNIIEYENDQGTTIVNIWGYNKTRIVARLEGISYGQIPQNRITTIQNASNGSNEVNLLNALNALRNDGAMANALITTYTYKPLIGISTEADYRGRRISYHYDGFGRLKEVRDQNNNLLTEKEYYYQTQN